jgi:hypothetical protein
LTVEADLERLFAGRQPSKTVIDAAIQINWWWVERSWSEARHNKIDFQPLIISGTRSIYRPLPRSFMVRTGMICWMDPAFKWCRCVDGWYRLGESEGEVPTDQRIY